MCGSVSVLSTAEAVLQEMDNISSIRQNREVERLRMWTGDTEEVCVKHLNLDSTRYGHVSQFPQWI